MLVDGMAIVDRFVSWDGVALGTGRCAHDCDLVFGGVEVD